MSMYIRPFEIQAATQAITVTGSNTSTAITAEGIGNRSIRLANIGTQTVFVSITDRAATASVTTSAPILANSVEVFLLRRENNTINTIAATTGSTLYVTVGESA